jgi:hypothetical protein
MTAEVFFVDSGRESECEPDPHFPNGKPIFVPRHPLQKTCTLNLPYPAPRCGFYAIKCTVCGISVLISVAGRPDDPNKVIMPCKLN